jgi:ankyrin repeat protein
MKRLVVVCVICAVALGGGARAAHGADARVAEAAMERDMTALRALISRKADVNVPLPDGATALHWAVHWDDRQAAELLVRSGSKVNAANDYGVTPLSIACTNRSESMVRALLNAGADPNLATNTGETPLMTCAYTGNAAAVRAVLAKGADVNAREQLQLQTALMWAASQGHGAAVKALLDGGADIRARSGVRRHFICFQVQCGHDDPNEHVSRGGYTAALFAARSGDVESLRLLLDAGAALEETGADGYSLLLLAAHSGHTELAKFLLERGADPNASGVGYSVLHTAVLRGDLELVKALIAKKASLNDRITKPAPMERFTYKWMSMPLAVTGATALLLASKYLEVPIMQALVAAGADTRLPTNDGTTPLMAVAGVNWSTNGSADRRDRTVDQAEIRAVLDDEARVVNAVRILLAAGVDLDTANKAGNTALHGAATLGMKNVYRLLVDSGARADLKNRAGDTPAAVLTRAAGRSTP